MGLKRVVANRQRVDRELTRRVGHGLGHRHRAKRGDHRAGNRPAVIVADDTGDAATHVADGLVLGRLGQCRWARRELQECRPRQPLVSTPLKRCMASLRLRLPLSTFLVTV